MWGNNPSVSQSEGQQTVRGDNDMVQNIRLFSQGFDYEALKNDINQLGGV